MLTIKKLRKKYPKNDSFQLIIDDFAIKEGSIIGLVGPNGAGKTTLLKIIVKLLYPDSGDILFRNQNINENLIINNISYMPGNKNLYENMTVKQMLAFASRSVPHWNNEKAEKLLSVFPLKLNKKISTLSYGEKTQLYAIITFSKNVPFIILDEPTQGLDPVMQERMLSLIKDESSEGKTILFSSHQLNEVEASADTIAIMKSGQIVLSGIIDDLKDDLFMIVTDKDEIEVGNFDIIAKRRQGNKTILIGRKTSKPLDNNYPTMKVNLKDIFLTIIEGEVGK
ncbi:MAG: ABC transporter ATP-binding protein [Syntrophomonadaceae bacterium]|nr:ABC transporter ATP-binding protein [Syntrophomonadaceae bacterium]